MPPKQSFIEQTSYPHMGPKDTEVWTRFIRAFPERYKEVSYDIKIGFAPAFVTKDEEEIGGNVANLYLRKMDVIGYRPDGIDIIEVKPKAGFSAVGQLLGYLTLWKEKYGFVAGVELVLVCGEAPLDVRMLAENSGIEVYVV